MKSKGLPMLDFNDPQTPAPRDLNAERETIRAELLVRLDSVLTALFPAGKKRRDKFLIGDVLGSPGDSLEIVLGGDKAGLWTDRANGDGGDVFTLIAAHFGIDAHADFVRVLDAATELLRRAPAAPKRKSRKETPIDELGPATAKWDYLDVSGKLIAVVYRYDPPGRKKEFRPWDVRRRKMAPPDPRPLYNQPGTAVASQVVLVEGEKCAQALIEAGVVATTAMHGANAPVDKTDWSPLFGKGVLIWPDRDKPGWEYATQAAQAILSAGAKSCHILYPPEEAADGWDAADAVAKGFDVAAFLAHGPRLQMHDVTDAAEPVVGSDESVWGTEDALALAFTRRYHRDWRYVAAWSRWLVWDGHRWCNEETLAATDLIRSVCRHAAVHADNPRLAAKLAASGTVSGVERLARSDRRHAATTGEWDADPWLLNTPGGVIDLRTGRQRPHDRADRVTTAHRTAAQEATNARSEIARTLAQTQSQIDEISAKLRDGLKLTLDADTSRFDQALRELDTALAERQYLLQIQADLQEAEKKLKEYEQLLKEGKTLPVDADVSKAREALERLKTYADQSAQFELKLTTEKAQAAIGTVERQINALNPIQTESRHRVNRNAAAARAEIMSLNGLNTSSTHTIYVTKVGNARRRPRPGLRQVGLPRHFRQADRGRLPLRPTRSQEGVPPLGRAPSQDGTARSASAVQPARSGAGQPCRADRRRKMRAGADRCRCSGDHGDAWRKRAGGKTRLVAIGGQSRIDLARP
jgi:DNA primase